MKQKTLNLKRNILVIEAPEETYFEVFNHGILFKDHLGAEREFIEGSYTLLGSLDDLKEEDVKDLVDIQPHWDEKQKFRVIGNAKFCYLQSFNSALENEITKPFDFKRTLIFIENEKL